MTKPTLILYATREGQTARIADHVAAVLRERGQSARVRDVREIREPFGLDRYGAAILAASVHVGKHEKEMLDFVKKHRAALDQMPTAFISVSLSEAGAEDPNRTEEQRAQAAANAKGVLDTFLAATGWRPGHIKSVAGALLYTKYNFLVRFVMKRISRAEGGPTDTSRDYELTDWKGLDAFLDELVGELESGVHVVSAPPT